MSEPMVCDGRISYFRQIGAWRHYTNETHNRGSTAIFLEFKVLLELPGHYCARLPH